MSTVNKIDIDGVQWDIEDYYARERISSAFTYSYDEIDTGKIWVNGEKIYRKVVKGSNYFDNVHWTGINIWNDNRQKIITDINMMCQMTMLRCFQAGLKATNELWFSTVASSGNGSSGTFNYLLIVEYTKI
jgi:hypothetical protein